MTWLKDQPVGFIDYLYSVYELNETVGGIKYHNGKPANVNFKTVNNKKKINRKAVDNFKMDNNERLAIEKDWPKFFKNYNPNKLSD